jgi:hypothetical protein
VTVLALDCPHCGVKSSSFEIRGYVNDPADGAWYSIFATCNACHQPIAARMRTMNGSKNLAPSNYQGNLNGRGSPWVLVEIYPNALTLDTPSGIPAGVERAYIQAAASRRAGHLDAAAAMYRKAMELALKDLSPEIEAWKIEKRIDKMAKEGLITKELQGWAHELRLDGNDVLHEVEASLELTDQMHNLCKFLLTYLFSLPEQVKAARARRSPAADD